jgi:ABC-type uncharacterized transport system substrate-binding protein
MTDQVAELGDKEIQIIREVVPRTRRVAILWNESNPCAQVTFEQTRAAATKAGLEVATVAVRHQDDLENAVAKAAGGRPDVLVVTHDILTVSHRAQVGRLALKHKLPSICASTPFVDAGGIGRIRPQPSESLQASSDLCGPDLPRSKACRDSCRAAHGVPTEKQSQDG